MTLKLARNVWQKMLSQKGMYGGLNPTAANQLAALINLQRQAIEFALLITASMTEEQARNFATAGGAAQSMARRAAKSK